MTDNKDKKCEGSKGYCETQKKYEDTVDENMLIFYREVKI